ncbi:hypothetical protein B0T18DRAFT_139639 [Schizothecium vesticola]|uniref:Uncharacterized protein n=1 Tax=Schizothecium vesticola TaxID=314040 RepID=A0AA40EV12_9PEZI|nr:hypothetical protein B0T18DRAFT_139639 [Schizothecium vesticola]
MVSLNLPTVFQHQIEPYRIVLPSRTISVDLRLSENLHFGAPPLPNRPAGRCFGPRASDPGRYPIDDEQRHTDSNAPSAQHHGGVQKPASSQYVAVPSSLAVTMAVCISHANQQPALFRQVPSPARLQTALWPVSWRTSHPEPPWRACCCGHAAPTGQVCACVLGYRLRCTFCPGVPLRSDSRSSRLSAWVSMPRNVVFASRPWDAGY